MREMKRSKHKLAASLLTAIAMVFTLMPCMGADVAEADTSSPPELHCTALAYPEAESVSFDERTRDCTNADKNTNVYSKSFKADSTKMFLASASYVDESGYGWDTKYDLQVTDSSGNTITRGFADSSSGYKYLWKFTKSDTYTFSLICDYGGSGKCAYNVKGELQNAPAAPTEKFSNFKAEYVASTNSVNLSYETYEGAVSDNDYNIYLREDFDAKKVIAMGSASGIYRYHYESDGSPQFDKTYIYYVVKQKMLNEALPGFEDKVFNRSGTALDDSSRTKLQSISTSVELKTPTPPIVKVKNLNITAGIKKADLTWDYTYDGAPYGTPYVSGYYVKIYKGNGAKYAAHTVSGLSASCVIPYTGTYYFTVTPYYVYNGKTYTGNTTAKVSCASKKLSAATGSVTKMSDKKARITINKSAGSTGTMVYQYTGGKWVKLGSTTGSSYTAAKNTAGKKKYRLQAYVKDSGKTYKSAYSKTYSPQANAKTFSYSNYPASYKQLSHYWRPNKIYYAGGKVVVNGKFINTHIYTLAYCKIKLTVKCQGKTIGTKTINSGKLKPNQVKKVTVKLDHSKTGYDLRVGSLEWSYNVISYY